MRYLPLITLLLISIVFIGCSKSDMTSPASVPESQIVDSKPVILGSGRMNLDTGCVDVLRDSFAYYDVTPYIGGNFSYQIDDVIPPHELDITLSLENTSGMTVHDVCIMFDELYGKTVSNPDFYIDIFEPYDINPVIAFKIDDPNRAFPPGIDTQRLLLDYPPGAEPYVDFFIIAHLGGNTGGVYDIDGSVNGSLFPFGGNAEIVVLPFDYQRDVSMVVADTRLLTGDFTFLALPDPHSDTWEAEITNSEGLPTGDYDLLVMATSPSSPQYNTYDYLEFEILRDPGTLYVDDDNTSGPWDGSIEYPFQYVQDAVDVAIDGHTIWIKPGIYHEDEGGSSTSPDAEITIQEEINYLTIKGEGMPIVVLHDYVDEDDLAAIKAYGCNNLVIDGLEFTPGQFYEYAVILNGCEDSVLRNCRVTPGPATGFKGFLEANSCSGLVVENNSCDGMMVNSDLGSWGFEFISINSCENAKISLNTLRGMTQSSIPVSPPNNEDNYEYDLFSIGGCDGVEVSKNIIGDINWGFEWSGITILTVFEIFANDYCVIRNNLVYDISLTDYANDDLTGLTGINIGYCNYAQVHNNTFNNLSFMTSGEGSEIAGMWAGNELNEHDIYNNIFTSIYAPGITGWGYGIASGNFVVQTYSDVWNISEARYYWNAMEGEGGIDAYPMYVDPDMDDYHLIPGSPCEGTGRNGDDMGCHGGADPLP